ncbi:unnamed protein product [Darwinula stevensoni]|uniref:Protein SMG7 n=1 Tax=Darwinula stevensoni TaxID=69355 RepID=A0A7R9FQB0_9CRUS|nr:unnamed protein product [Darwinula stevensoni]CAG0899096.1 unnamed protein product [Darwinula stevensoni]
MKPSAWRLSSEERCQLSWLQLTLRSYLHYASDGDMKQPQEIHQEAESVKLKLEAYFNGGSPNVTKSFFQSDELWTILHQLQSLYRDLLIKDVELALDRRVEQDLWNQVFRSQITFLQKEARDKKNPRRGDSSALLRWFIDSASGFYTLLIGDLCDIFNIGLPFHSQGVGQPLSDGKGGTSLQKSVCYLCQYCLTHLGDLARYKGNLALAESYYRHAISMVPSGGQPYNQIALLNATRGDSLAAVFYYVRSMSVAYPFIAAKSNLEKMLSQFVSDSIRLGNKVSMSGEEYMSCFLKLHALIQHPPPNFSEMEDLQKALASRLPSLIATAALPLPRLIQMVGINLHAVDQLSKQGSFHMSIPNGHAEEWSLAPNGHSTTQNPKITSEKSATLIMDLLAAMLSSMLLPTYTIKAGDSMHDYYALPAVKLLLDWVRCNPDVLETPAFSTRPHVWPSLCHLLNELQSTVYDFPAKDYASVPLPEDHMMVGFLPLNKVLRCYTYSTKQKLVKKTADLLRGARLTSLGRWLSQQTVSNVKIIEVQELNESQAEEGSSINQENPELSDTSHKPRGLCFKPVAKQVSSTEMLQQLQQLSADPKPSLSSKQGHLNHGDNSGGLLHFNPPPGKDLNSILEGGNQTPPMPRMGILRNHAKAGTEDTGSKLGRKGMNNVALQTILKKSAMAENVSNKQVTFKTPSPSSSEVSLVDESLASPQPPSIMTTNTIGLATSTAASLRSKNLPPLLAPHFNGEPSSTFSYPPPNKNQFIHEGRQGFPPLPNGDHPSFPTSPSDDLDYNRKERNEHGNSSNRGAAFPIHIPPPPLWFRGGPQVFHMNDTNSSQFSGDTDKTKVENQGLGTMGLNSGPPVFYPDISNNSWMQGYGSPVVSNLLRTQVSSKHPQNQQQPLLPTSYGNLNLAPGKSILKESLMGRPGNGLGLTIGDSRNGPSAPPSYSLFSSPWGNSNLLNFGLTDTSLNPPMHNVSLHSIWNTPGLTPLEKLLEQQKGKKGGPPP